MPLFYRKSAKVDPTRYWVGDNRFHPEVDLDTHSLNGARVGGLFDGLERLGPAEDRAAAEEGILLYYSRGLEICVEDGNITGLRLVWVSDEGFRPFAGTVKKKGEALSLGPTTTEEQLRTLFGEPYWRDEDPDEILLFYEFGKVEWQIELTPSGTLMQWILCTPPLMADAAQRRAYGVTKPWPPA
ncbi:MAG TPA: hypothetical protein VNJ09_05165 [Chthonomonadales bacterium]|nr:hypothetical protein [Chthonomonadales bacterium]